MKRFLRSRLSLTLAAFIIVSTAIAIPLSNNILHSHAAPSSSQGSWNIVPSPANSSNYRLLGTMAVSSNDVWAVGYAWDKNTYKYTTLAIHWDGSSWITVPTPNQSSINNFLQSVTAVSSNDVWAVGYASNSSGYGDTTLVIHWDGSSWAIVSTPIPITGGYSYYHLNSVTAVSSNDVWAVGYASDYNEYYYKTLAMHWDGSSWTVVSTPNSSALNVNGQNYLNSVTAISTNDVWAVGYAADASTGVHTLAMHWDGSSWTVVSTPNSSALSGQNYLNSVTAISTNDVWAVGYTEGSSYESNTFTIHWDGSSWTVVSTPNPSSGNNILYSVTAISASNIWAVGYTEDSTYYEIKTFIIHWDGSSWTTVSSPNIPSDSNYLYSVTADAANDVWAVGNTNNGSLIEQYTPSTPLGGKWISPGNNFTITGNTLHFAAHAYGGAGVDHVNFTAWWPGIDPNNWYIPCQVTNPTPGTTDVYECDWNLTDGSGKTVLNGTLNVSFDVYDKGGNKILSPNGVHQGTIQRPVSLLAPFNKGDTFYVKNLGGYHNKPQAGCRIGTFPDHCNNQLFGLDLVPDQQSDTTILAPVGGIITGIPSDPNEFGCMQLMLYDGLSLNVCHFSTWTVTHGQQVVQGQVLGTRMPSTVHVHLSLDNRPPYSTCNGCLPVPFNGTHTIEGMSLNPNHDGKGQTVTYAGQTFLVDMDEWQDWKGTSSN